MTPEGWDWARVQHEPCPQCGVDASAVAVDDLPAAVSVEAQAWELLLHGDDDALRTRPDAETWSPLEYGCHVRDVLSVMGDRVVVALVEDAPEFGWWDHEAAADDEHYNEQDPRAVAGDLAANAARLAGVLALVEGDEWERSGTRRGTEPFTVAGLGRFALHEAAHHRWDVEGGRTTG